MAYQYKMTPCQSLKPFEDRKSRYIDRDYFSHNSSVDRAREVFKLSADSASLLVSTEKCFFSFGIGVLCGWCLKWGRFCVFLADFTQPWTPSQRAIFWLKVFLKSGISLESLEPLIDFLAKLWLESSHQKSWLESSHWLESRYHW